MIGVLQHIFDKSKPKCKGVIHVGAHYGQEIPLYFQLGIENIIAYEPLDQCFEKLYAQFFYKDVALRKKCVGNLNGEIEMNVEEANHGQSSSVLAPKKHLEQYPDIKFDKKVTVPIVRLDDDVEFKDYYNVLVVDVQGYELEVFKGATELLRENIEYIICEVNYVEMYSHCAMVEDIDFFLRDFGFKRVMTTWEGGDWGNALYVKL